MVRVAWGGGSEKMWEGSISVNRGSVSQPRPLGIEADEPGSMWLEDGRLIVRQQSPRAFDGVDLVVTAPADAKLVVQLTAAGSSQRGPDIEVPLAELSAEFHNLELDKQDSRLLVRRAPGDALLFHTSRSSLVFSPGETFRGEILPHALPFPTDAGAQIKMQLLNAQQRALWSSTTEIRGGAEPLPVDLTLPDEEGVYDLIVTAQPKAGWPRGWRNSLQWKRSAVERRVQLIVISGQRPTAGRDREPGQILEIDPAAPRSWEKIKLPSWPRFARGAVPAAGSAPLGNGMRETIHHSLGDVSQLKPSAASPDVSWEAYPLSIGNPGRPHVLEVDYPSDVPQTLGISIIETNAAGALAPIGLDSGIDVSDEAASAVAPHWQRHRLVFWPRTTAPLVLVTNRRRQSPAVYGKLRVLAGWEHLPDAGAPSSRPAQRLVAAYMDRPLLPENFSADEVLDAWSGRTLHDWRTFHQAGLRLTEYLRYAGYNGLMLSVAADGSAIYPSQVLEPTPRYDTGVFFASGQDPMPKDVLEMLLRLMDREGLQLVPSIEFAAPLPELESLRRRGGKEADGLEWVGSDGSTWRQTYATRRGLAPYYNTLDPRVQQAMLEVVRELVARYAGHPSFRGLALRLSAYGYAQLPGPEWGLDDGTLARFENDTGLKLPGEGEKRFAARAAFLASDEHRARWLQWRAGECRKFYHRVQDVLETARHGTPLYLAGAEMLAGPDVEGELRPGLLRPSSFPAALLQAGIDPALYRDDAKVVLLRSQRILPAAPLNVQAIDLELSQSSDADAFFRGLPQPGSLYFHPPLESRVPSFDQKMAVKSGVLLLSQIVPSGAQNRRRFAEGLARHDAQLIVDGGWMLPLGQEDATQRFTAGFRRLPAIHFADAEAGRAGQPVVFRWATQQGKTFAYAVNTTPFVVAAQVRVAASPNCALDDLSGGGRPGRLTSDSSGLLWNVELQPYDLAAVSFSEPDARLFQPETQLPEQAAQWITGRIRELGARAVVLRAPPPLQVLENAGFQSQPTAAEPVPGWSISKRPKISIVTDTTQGHVAEGSPGAKGAQSVRISSDGPVACLVSRPFAAPRTGRLAMSVWLKVADAEHQPVLRLAVEGKLAGREYYRFAVIGQPPAPGQPASPIDTTWQRFIVPFNDLPLEGLAQMHVRLDLMGAGQVWADDIQLFDLAFNESELRAIYKLLTLADAALQNGEAGESVRLLHGYWPRFLAENVPLAPPVPALAAKPAAEQPADSAPPASAGAPPVPPGLLDRVKGIFPENWR